MKLLIYYLTSDSRHFTFRHFVRMLNMSKRKELFTLFVLTHSNDQEFYKHELDQVSMNYLIANVHPHNNYMVKCNAAVEFAEKHSIPFLMKCDNDIFLLPQTLDYMIDSLDILNTGPHLTLGPVLSSGIPGVEYFAKEFLSNDERETLEKMYLTTTFYNRDGATYSHLNEYTLSASKWDADSYFKEVWRLPHHYKGVHPIRMNMEAIDYLNKCILNNKDSFFKSMPRGLILDDTAPYLCDSIFCIRTDTYKKIIQDQSLFVDSFDEVPLNKYANTNSLNHVFVDNGFAIHMLYNWYNNLHNYERQFCDVFFM